MSGENFRDILAFLAVARERSFTRAAAQLGVSQSALSHTIRALEARLGLRLLTRTTRSVSPTEAGERLIQSVAPRFEAITDELAAFEELRDKPAGTVRITASDFAANTILWPKLSKLQPKYPDVKIEIAIEPALTDIVAERFDAGVRFGDQIAKDMTAVRISPDIRMVIVGAPSYLEGRPRPKTPSDLTEHECINMRFSMRGGMYAWELSKGGRNLQVRVEGSWTFNCIYPVVEAALAGFGLAYMPEVLARPHLKSGRLQAVLKDWSPTFPGLHIFFASRRQSSPVLSLIVEELRYRH
ncbi:MULTISPECIES: LysR family transcriptional regulator [Ralstonia solanacearum species complex]|uniref:LysR family transcriptional regulator n=1 Tax=Ralstonia solanacearum K60 TaxID=1091042 RepID=A0AAP7ZJV3_RALSL|nr:LysR family transcriptional regulator [Ralstonia solanacearum]OYQ11950.1 LysR family transcriptional regulator [Ralstonia solanacearum K60]QOK82307.1 LysR family transcriptional regulator [Ralstonia solanacearum]CCF96071.1 putative transcriptional regulator, LysR family [Ralstonia solanacearum K60]